MKLKSKGIFFVSFAGFLMLLSSCKSSSQMGEDAVSEVMTTDGSDPVVIVLGGYWSCGSETMSKNKADWSPKESHGAGASMYTIITRQNQAIKNALKGDFGVVMSCYYPEIEITGINYINNLDGNNSIARTDLNEMFQSINSSLEKLKNPKVTIVGHSYGGWTAMKLVQNLNPKATLNTLVTIDPISRENCRPRALIENLTLEGPGVRGCNEAPSDFDGKAIDMIARRAGSWYNYYQTSAVKLHSSTFSSSLVKNEEVIYQPKDKKFESHILFMHDTKFIDKITDIIIQNMKK